MTPPPVPPAQPGELEHFHSLGWLPPNFKPKTLEGLAVVKQYYRELISNRYCIQLNKDYINNIHEQMQRFLEHVLPAEHKISRQTKDKNILDMDVFYVTYRHHWVYSKHFRHGSMIIQFATIQLWSAITRTRPGVLLPQKASPAGMPQGKRKGDKAFQSDLPKYVSTDDLPASVCYRNIELFYLKDPDNKRDVLYTIIKFCNLKGWLEAYCPINQIILLAFRNRAFLNTALTLELIWRLRVPKRSQSLPLQWKPEMLDTPLLQHLERTTYGYELHKSLLMTYDSSQQALQELGRDARFKDDIGNFTSQEQQRVLGQLGNREGLLWVARSMLRKRDPQAPTNLIDAQKCSICQNPKTARREYFHNAPVLEIDKQIKQMLGQSDVEQSNADSSKDEDWELPIPEYNFDKDKLLARYIQVTKDMVALSQLCKPTRRGNQINWDINNNNRTEKLEEPSPAKGESLEYPTNVCIICCGQSQLSLSNPPPHKFPAKRQDSVHHHLIDSHLAHAHDRISCTWPACHGIPKFTNITEFLAYAVAMHTYDINIKLYYLPTKQSLTCSDTSSVDSTVESIESYDRLGTDTPASSVGPETANIDPRLLESHKPKVTEPLPRCSKRLRLR
ncbi:uncharacterized protein BJX67DRAFT_371439 [Aspergillus lucknowensis]|uniref:Uncharacterized protein n=1 Tax=Aspergillus lucknowensis TaxID=176173 RepID=A0ABR4LV01_9EURO